MSPRVSKVRLYRSEEHTSELQSLPTRRSSDLLTLLKGRLDGQDGYPPKELLRRVRSIMDVTTGLESASIWVNARLAGLYSAPGSLFCRDALGAAEVRRAHLNVRYMRDRVAVPGKSGGQTASAPVIVGQQAWRPVQLQVTG